MLVPVINMSVTNYDGDDEEVMTLLEGMNKAFSDIEAGADNILEVLAIWTAAVISCDPEARDFLGGHFADRMNHYLHTLGDYVNPDRAH